MKIMMRVVAESQKVRFFSDRGNSDGGGEDYADDDDITLSIMIIVVRFRRDLQLLL